MLSYISLFSSAGVGCFGFKQESYTCTATLEINPKRLNIQKYNQKCKYDTGYIEGDIQNKNIKLQLLEEINNFKKREKIKNIDVLIATPPCQGMSVINTKKNNELNRNSLIIESINLILDIKPNFFIFENVLTFLKSICTDKNINKTIKEAILDNLSQTYSINYKVINLKNYGSNSSRTRTLVIGVKKTLKDITPDELFPDYVKEKTLKEVIGNLPILNKYGEINENDIYHSFKEYKKEMINWIKDLKEGENAFNNKEDINKPHKIIDNKIVINKNKNNDKYKRQFWNKVAPCIHTRNDILSSQNTIHPRDNRVFSIRELMKLMTIPDNFKWTNIDLEILNKMSFLEKKKFLKQNELNIRKCIGESIPTQTITNIAIKIKNYYNKKDNNKNNLN